MKIDLRSIKDDQERLLDHYYDPVTHELEFDDCHYDNPIHLAGTAVRQNETLHVRGRLESHCVLTCSRCLEEFGKDISELFDNYYDIKNKHVIDITDDIREQIIFLHQQRYLCDDACKGICPRCGQNHNRGTCSCDTEIDPSSQFSDSSFSDLKKIINNREKEKE